MGGMCSYYHDLIYLAAIVQVASIASDRIWWSFLVVSSLLGSPCKGLHRCKWGQSALEVVHRHLSQSRLMVTPAVQVPAYALYVLWGLVQPYLGSVFGAAPKVRLQPIWHSSNPHRCNSQAHQRAMYSWAFHIDIGFESSVVKMYRIPCHISASEPGHPDCQSISYNGSFQ